MHREPVEFYSEGSRISGDILRPSEDGGPWPTIIHGPGWLGLKDARLYLPYHEALTAAGFAVLVFDYRGFGASGGSATFLDPIAQVHDIINAVSYAESRADVDASRLGVFGSGGTGGGNAVLAAAWDDRLKAMVAQVPIADGRDWLHRMRRESEWLEFLERIREDRVRRAVTGEAEMVRPRDGIMVPTPERRTTTVKADVDERIPAQVELASASAIFAYKPIDHVASIAPRASMFICVEGDATTPEDHAVALFERASSPKRLVTQSGTTHYGAYAKYAHVIAPLIVDWFSCYLTAADVRVTQALGPRAERPAGFPTDVGVTVEDRP
jgi:acetyl esterase/lipase